MLSELAPAQTSEELLSYILYKECSGNLEEAAIFITTNNMDDISGKMKKAKQKQLEKENLEKKKIAELEKKEHRMMLDKFLVVGDTGDAANNKKVNKSKNAKAIRREQRKAQQEKKINQ